MKAAKLNRRTDQDFHLALRISHFGCAAFDENLTRYKHPQNGIPALFVFNALLIASNGTDSRVGSLPADWERFHECERTAVRPEGKPVGEIA